MDPTEAVRELVAFLEAGLAAGPRPGLTALEDLSLRHLAKATGTAGSALRLIADARWVDACILTRAIFEQLFSYLWVVQDADKAASRAVMVTLKQEWANAKYLEGLAKVAPAENVDTLLQASQAYREVAEALLTELATSLGLPEKKVRDEASLRVSAKAVEVNLGPAYSVPYAYYSGFVHTDGNALAAYGQATPAGWLYSPKSERPTHVPLAADIHRALLRVALEVESRCSDEAWGMSREFLQRRVAWQAAADDAGRA